MKNNGWRCASERIVEVVCLLLLAVCFLGFSDGFAQECTDSGVRKGVEFWDQGKFGMATKALDDAINKLQKGPKTQSATQCLETARLFAGFAHFSLGNRSKARQYFNDSPCRTLSNDDYKPDLIEFYNGACRQVSPPVASLIKPVEPPRVGGENFGHILVSSVPDSAGIYLDGKLVPTRTPYLVKDLSAGEHELRIFKDGFKESKERVSVKPGEVAPVIVRLVPLTYTVRISSTPAGADVTWNNTPRGKTPLVIDGVTSGKYRLSLTRENYVEQTDMIEVQNSPVDRTYALKEAPKLIKEVAKPTLSVLSVKSNVDAEVFLDNVRQGRTPVRIPEIKAGRHTVRTVYGTQTKEESVTLESGRDLEITMDFQVSGHIHVSSVPDSAGIYLDGKLVPTRTPYLAKDLSAGEHELRIFKDGFKESKERVSVKPGEVASVTVRLVSIAPPQPESKPSITGEGFIIKSDGTVIHKATGLMWLKNANYPMMGMNWDAAMKYCEGLKYAGYNDWKLPSREEWKTIVGSNGINKTFPAGHPFTNVVMHGNYWSSSVNPMGLTHTYAVNVGNGGVESFNKTRIGYVWPVRYASDVDLAEKK